MAVTTAQDAPADQPAPRAPRRRRFGLVNVMAAFGRLLIAVGLVMILFVVYQLWGTGLITARAQDDLRSRFEELLAQAPTTAAPATTATTTATTVAPGGEATTTTAPATTTTVAVAPLPPPVPGGPLAQIEIPTIGVDWIVAEGVDLGTLADGPGHYPGTAMPGHRGNVAIAGHRTTYGAPFYRLNELRPGDEIVLTSPQGRFTYEVTTTQIVTPTQWEVVAPTDDARVTLTSCHPRYSSRERIVVQALLRGEPAATPPPAPGVAPVDGSGQLAGGNHLVTQVYLDDDGGDPDAVRPSMLLGAAVVAVWALVWAVGRLWRRWPAYLLGTPAVLGVLFVFFTQFSRLLPASY